MSTLPEWGVTLLWLLLFSLLVLLAPEGDVDGCEDEDGRANADEAISDLELSDEDVGA